MQVDKTKCVGCGCCMGICPAGAISLKDGKATIDPTKCISCHQCAATCPMQAIIVD